MSISFQEMLGRAIRLDGQGAFSEASELYRQLLKRAPGQPDLHHLYGVSLLRSQDFAAAEKHIKQSLRIRPDTPPYLNSLGMLYFKSGEARKAEDSLRRAIMLAPEYPDPVLNLGNLRVSQQRYPEAIELFRKGVGLSPNNPVAHLSLGNAYKKTGRLESAANCYREAVRINPAYAQAHYNLGLALMTLGQYPAALQSAQSALSCVPDYTAAHMLAGQIHEHLGNIDQATECYRRCLKSGAGHPAAYWSLANIGRYHFSPSEIDQMQQLLAGQPKDDEKIELHFALAQALEQQDRFPDAFEQLVAGNRLKRKQLDYSAGQNREFLARQKMVFNERTLQSWPAHGLDTVSPLFILGMPRSGTSLVEQILASHSQVAGGGELETSLQIVHAVVPEITGKEPLDALLSLEPAHLRQLGEYYCQQNRPLIDAADYFTDKLPFNFALLGLLACIFPKARFVHVYKHPLDVCLGCYRQLFTQGQLFSFDLDELADFYIEYRRIMQHWQMALPERLVNVSYEQLVASPASEIARLLNALGLPWEDACLDFHANRRVVRTASAGQVRSGIYQSAVSRWKQYQAELQPLATKLRSAGIDL